MPMFQKLTHSWQGLFLSLLRLSIFIIDVLKAIVLLLHQLQCFDRIHGSKGFSVLDDFRQQAQERGLPLTLSMGISFGTF